jgi:adenylyltransferase/sulfurtransferase
MSIIQFLRYNPPSNVTRSYDAGGKLKKNKVLVIGAGGLGCPIYNI